MASERTTANSSVDPMAQNLRSVAGRINGGNDRAVVIQAARRQEQLQGIVDRLNKTRDGAPVVHGMPVFPDDSGFPNEYKGLRWIVDDDTRYARTVIEGDPMRTPHGMILVHLMYSTEQAARAAAEADQKEGDSDG